MCSYFVSSNYRFPKLKTWVGWKLKTILGKCRELKLCWWRQKIIPDNCSQLLMWILQILQNIATFRRWIVPSPSNNLIQKKHHFCFAISCIVKTKMQMLSLNENHKDWSLLNFPLSHPTYHSTCLSHILTFQPSTTASPSAWSPSPLPWPSSPSTSTTWVCAGKM